MSVLLLLGYTAITARRTHRCSPEVALATVSNEMRALAAGIARTLSIVLASGVQPNRSDTSMHLAHAERPRPLQYMGRSGRIIDVRASHQEGLYYHPSIINIQLFYIFHASINLHFSK